jgi:uncharacterized protein RhaS with RHS repeats
MQWFIRRGIVHSALSIVHYSTTSLVTATYDLVGNRTALWENGQLVQQHSYNAANQVIGWQYDGAGNLLSDGTNSYTYDPLNRLTQHNSTTYGYNGDGILVRASSGGSTTRYTQDLAAPLAQVLSDNTHTYVYGHERLLAVQGDTRIWHLADALGSLRMTLDSTGTPQSLHSYDAWGVVQEGTPAPFGFTGEMQQV